jgi:hypothetical protein
MALETDHLLVNGALKPCPIESLQATAATPGLLQFYDKIIKNSQNNGKNHSGNPLSL